MSRQRLWLLLAGFIILFISSPSIAAERPKAEEIMRKYYLSFYYAGNDFRARVLMRLINKQGQERQRDMVMLRKNYQPGGEQKYFIYFYKPADVRDMTFMVWKYPDKNDSRWLFIPAINLVRRIAASDKRSSFVGSDFTYEDISGREVAADTHKLLREEVVADKECYLIESLPQEEAEYIRKLCWIDKSTFLPLKEEYYDRQGELYKVFTADAVREVDGFWTVTRRTMKNIKTGHRTEVTLSKVKYNIGLTNAVFSERSLRRPSKKWLK